MYITHKLTDTQNDWITCWMLFFNTFWSAKSNLLSTLTEEFTAMWRRLWQTDEEIHPLVSILIENIVKCKPYEYESNTWEKIKLKIQEEYIDVSISLDDDENKYLYFVSHTDTNIYFDVL